MKKHNRDRFKSIIKRQKPGRTPTRYDINLKLILPRHSVLLLNHQCLGDVAKDDRLLNILFNIEDDLVQGTKEDKVFINPITKEIGYVKNIKEDIKKTPWNCAYCSKDILCSTDSYKPTTFCCDRCIEYYNVEKEEYVSERITNSMFEFFEMYKRAIQTNRKEYFSNIKEA